MRAWTLPVGTSAPQAAGVIHPDFQRGFIRADTSFDQLIERASWRRRRPAGGCAWGKEYVVQDDDVV